MAEPSKLVSGKMFQLIIDGQVPMELVDLPHDQLAAAIIAGFQVNLGVVSLITNFHCKLLQQIPPKSQGHSLTGAPVETHPVRERLPVRFPDHP